MDASFFLRGILLGFSIAAPVGPIGVLCIRRTLERGWAAGFVSGLGAATADGFYGAVAGFGLTIVISFLTGVQLWLRLAGGIFLVYLGIVAFRKAAPLPARQSAAAPGGLAGAYGSTLLLTLSNPATILSFLTIFAGVGVAGSAQSIQAAVSLVAGVFCGSALWWLLLSSLVGWLGARLGPRVLLWVNRVAGILLAGFGLAILISAIPGVGSG
jgi:threonine/homoserine/homoserine lactone efflux protein